MALVTIGVTLPGSWLRWVSENAGHGLWVLWFWLPGGKELATRWVPRCVLATWLVLALPFGCFIPSQRVTTQDFHGLC